MEHENPCEALSEQLTRFALGDMTAGEVVAVEAHVATCATCASELALLRATIVELRGMPSGVDKLDEGRRESLVDQARAALEPRRRRAIRPIILAAAAIIPISIVATVLYFEWLEHRLSGGTPAEVAKRPAPLLGDDSGRTAEEVAPMRQRVPEVTASSARKETNERLNQVLGSESEMMKEARNAEVVTPDIPLGTSMENLTNVQIADGENRTGVNDAIGAGGGAAAAYGERWGEGAQSWADKARKFNALANENPVPVLSRPRTVRTESETAAYLPPGAALPKAAEPEVAGAPGEPHGTTPYPPSPEVQVEQILNSLAPRPGETPDMMFFRYFGDNPCVEAGSDPLSTFSVDVDTASYTLARNYLSRGIVPPKEAVRTEEFVNYFRGGYPAPKDGVFAIYTELAPSPFVHEEGYKLLRIGIKGREIPVEKRRPCALVFVIDCSGSMARENRIELVKQSLRLLVSRLDERDTIGIVMFQTTASRMLDPVGVDRSKWIVAAIDSLSAGGTTNAGDGILLGYEMASQHFLEGGNNRVILCSDGVANTGVTDPDAILDRVRGYRAKKIFLTAVGVGMGNHNDALLERLADAGDGQCVYVDRLEEARKLFAEKLMGTIETIAQDVKIQVAFDTEHVVMYRELGYENRAIADQDFRNDAVDAGEIGAGHEVTALYEILPLPGTTGRLATVTIRYKPVAGSAVEKPQELSAEVKTESAYPSFDVASPRFRLAAAVGEFSEILRRSYWARGNTLEKVLRFAEPLAAAFPEEKDVAEFVALVKQAQRILVQAPPQDELTDAVEAIKENSMLRARLARLESDDGNRELDELKRQNDELKHRIRSILERRIRR